MKIFRKKVSSKSGFTLVEMLIAMGIFVAFTGVLIGSYTSIVRSQREANEYRIMYSESRKVFETVIAYFRDGMIDYGAYPDQSPIPSGGEVSQNREIKLISKDGRNRMEIFYNQNEGVISLQNSRLQNGDAAGGLNYTPEEILDLNNPNLVKVTNFRIFVTPFVDPYDLKNVQNNSIQFQPKITIYANFSREFGNGKSYQMDLQTSISSRIYSQVQPDFNNLVQ